LIKKYVFLPKSGNEKVHWLLLQAFLAFVDAKASYFTITFELNVSHPTTKKEEADS